MEASADYYVSRLGFKVDFRTPGFVSVSRRRCAIFLCQGDQGHPGSWVWIAVSDADALLEEFRQSGAKIRHLPTNYDWAYEMQVEDLDGKYCALAPILSRTNLSVNGLTCMATAGFEKKVMNGR